MDIHKNARLTRLGRAAQRPDDAIQHRLHIPVGISCSRSRWVNFEAIMGLFTLRRAISCIPEACTSWP